MQTTYMKCKKIRTLILNTSAEVMNYSNWDNGFAAKQIREIAPKYQDIIGEIDISKLTKEEMIDLGFGRWSKDDPMFLIPLYLYQFLPDKINCNCISGSSVLDKSNMDTDNRCGWLAYGVTPSKEKE